jgi:ubiquinone/menaquinone biosynthesis C-methylase UbiE
MIHGREELQKAYRDDTVAREYVRRRFESPLGALLHSRQVEAVRQVIRDNAIDRAAEIAPGPARLTVDIAPMLKGVTLVDASLQMLTEARHRLAERGIATRAQLVQADAFRLPLRADLGLVYTFRLIRHFERDDRLRLYRGVASILRPGGWLVFDAVNEAVSGPLRAKARPDEYQHFDALLRPDALREELGAAGFQIAALTGVQHRYTAQMKCQVYLAPRSAALARAAMEVFERLGGEPLEWIVACRRG